MKAPTLETRIGADPIQEPGVKIRIENDKRKDIRTNIEKVLEKEIEEEEILAEKNMQGFGVNLVKSQEYCR